MCQVGELDVAGLEVFAVRVEVVVLHMVLLSSMGAISLSAALWVSSAPA